MSRAKSKGQSTLEYVILLGFVVAALIAMGVYMKRGSEGQLRRASDQVGEQYEAGNTTGEFSERVDMHQKEEMGVGAGNAGDIHTEVLHDTRKKTGWEQVVGLPPVGGNTNTTP